MSRIFTLSKESSLIGSSIVIAAFLVLGALYIGEVQAGYDDYADKIKFPVAELGNCKNSTDCRLYCNEDKNIPSCIRFQIKNELLSEEEAQYANRLLSRLDASGLPGKCSNASECFAYCESVATTEECLGYAEKYDLIPKGEKKDTIRKFAKLAAEGVSFPGGCKTRDACMTYCEDIAHIDECVAFAERSGVMPPGELIEAQKIRSAVRSGTKLPGGCNNKKECMTYCEHIAHIDECIVFAEKAGFMSRDELEQAHKFIPLIKAGQTPGGCKRKEECESYCRDARHIEECFRFAAKHGLVPEEDLAQAKKAMPFILKGEAPGGCISKETCHAYCRKEAHFDECVTFAKKAGLMSADEASQARQMGTKGPGECSTREQCEAFCKTPVNREACMNFAKEHQLFGEFSHVEEKVRAEINMEGRARIEERVKSCMARSCPELIACLQGIRAGTDDGKEFTQSGGADLLPAEVKTRLNSCIQEMQKSGGNTFQPGGVTSLPQLQCSFLDFHPVCADSHTFNNVCFAKQVGAANIQVGACIGHTSCPPMFAPVCGAKNGVTQSYYSACVASGDDATIVYQGECKIGTGSPSSTFTPTELPAEYQERYDAVIQEYCPNFERLTSCDYVGASGTQSYDICKKCFPNK